MHPNHQQEFGLLGRHQRHYKAVSRSVHMVCTRGGSGLNQCAGMPQSSPDFGSRALLR